MVSQRVSQQSQNTPKNDENAQFGFLEFATACPGFLGLASAKINQSDCEEKASTCETHGPHCLRSRSNGAGIAAETDGVSDKTTNSHNSQALRQDAKEFDDRQFRFGRSAKASTVQIPSSSEEVSTMPKKRQRMHLYNENKIRQTSLANGSDCRLSNRWPKNKNTSNGALLCRSAKDKSTTSS